MTAHVVTLTVLLDKDYRTDDAVAIVQAIRMVKGVQKVELGPVADPNVYWARIKERTQLVNVLLEHLKLDDVKKEKKNG